YILSKEVSVQYAFKKDGKGERHGDEAERELAAQAKKRNIVPEAQPVPQAFLQPPPVAAAPPAGFDPSAMGRMPGGVPPPQGMPGGFAPPGRGPSPYNTGVPPPGIPTRGPPVPLPPAPSGLPARPPQSQAGYTNPADFHPGSFRPP
ncbi:hypothetical protein ACHAPQ_012625, partial [Fusarium lateritium]